MNHKHSKPKLTPTAELTLLQAEDPATVIDLIFKCVFSKGLILRSSGVLDIWHTGPNLVAAASVGWWTVKKSLPGLITFLAENPVNYFPYPLHFKLN